MEVASCEAGAVRGGVGAEGAAFGRLLEILEDEEVRLDLKALIWFSRYDMVMIETCVMPNT